MLRVSVFVLSVFVVASCCAQELNDFQLGTIELQKFDFANESAVDFANSGLQTQMEPLTNSIEDESKVLRAFEPTVKITGFFQLDLGYYSQDEANRQTLGDIGDSLGFRRTRLAAKGKVTEDTSYIVEFDIAQSQARFVDVWMQLNGSRIGNVRIGRFRQPFGMSELTSVRELPFLERPLTFAQSPFRQTGVMLFDSSDDEQRTWAVSGYRYISDNFGNVYSDTGGYGLSMRLTSLPISWSDDRHLHVGVDYSFNTPGRDVVQIVNTNEFLGSQNPNLGPSGLSVLPIEGVPPFVNTGPINAESAQFFNFESALVLDRFAVQAETRWVQVQQDVGGAATFPGAYLLFRYMLTGEQIPFVKFNGTFGRIKPACPMTKESAGIGAWELSGRISYIDLNDSGITGRRLTDYTVGLNWYLNDYSKLQFNWINSQLNDVVIGDSVANTFAVRAQLDF